MPVANWTPACSHRYWHGVPGHEEEAALKSTLSGADRGEVGDQLKFAVGATGHGTGRPPIRQGGSGPAGGAGVGVTTGSGVATTDGAATVGATSAVTVFVVGAATTVSTRSEVARRRRASRTVRRKRLTPGDAKETRTLRPLPRDAARAGRPAFTVTRLAQEYRHGRARQLLLRASRTTTWPTTGFICDATNRARTRLPGRTALLLLAVPEDAEDEALSAW
jgi:hypothetical protein